MGVVAPAPGRGEKRMVDPGRPALRGGRLCQRVAGGGAERGEPLPGAGARQRQNQGDCGARGRKRDGESGDGGRQRQSSVWLDCGARDPRKSAPAKRCLGGSTVVD